MRKCPWNGCEAKLADSVFACRQHWLSLNSLERLDIHAAYNDYLAGVIGVEELRRRQQAVLGDRGQS